MGDAVSGAAGGIEEVKGRRREAGGRSMGRLRRNRDYDRIGFGAMIRLSVLGLCLLVPASAVACFCIPSSPICSSPPLQYMPAGAVFVGKVVDVYPAETEDAYFMALLDREVGPEEYRRALPLEELKRGLLRLWRGTMTAAELRRLTAARSERDLISLLGGEFLIHRRRVRFEVREVFQGPVKSVFEAFTGLNTGDCGLPFKNGEEWLVFANRDPASGRLHAGLCAGSRLLRQSRYELEVLRARKAGKTEERYVFGQVSDWTQRSEMKSHRAVPLGGVRLTLRSESGSELETKTDVEGRFIFADLKRSRYVLDLALPGWSAHISPAAEPSYDLTSDGCVEVSVHLTQDQGALVGRK